MIWLLILLSSYYTVPCEKLVLDQDNNFHLMILSSLKNSILFAEKHKSLLSVRGVKVSNCAQYNNEYFFLVISGPDHSRAELLNG